MNVSVAIEDHIISNVKLVSKDLTTVTSLTLEDNLCKADFQRFEGNGFRSVNSCIISNKNCGIIRWPTPQRPSPWLYKSAIVAYPALANLLPIFYTVSTYFVDKIHLKLEYVPTSGLSLKTGFNNNEQSFDGYIEDCVAHDEIYSREVQKYMFNNRYFDNDPAILSFNRDSQIKFIRDKLNSDELQELKSLVKDAKPLLDIREHLFFAKDLMNN